MAEGADVGTRRACICDGFDVSCDVAGDECVHSSVAPCRHEREPQLVCETCGYREALPSGSLIVSPEQVEQLREACETLIAYTRAYPANQASRYDSALGRRCLSILDADRKAEQ